MSREAVTHLNALQNDELQPMGFAGHTMPVALKVTVALTFCAAASFQEPTGDLYGVSQSTVHSCIREVTGALYRRANGFEGQSQSAVGFGTITEIPQVQGFTDCMHVVIKAPDRQPVTFLNRKGFYSLNLQLVCDHSANALHCTGSDPGWILGDKGNPKQTWLLTPVRNTTSDAEELFNTCQGSTRATIEQAIGMLKMWFRCQPRRLSHYPCDCTRAVQSS
ncbi:putative nuclease HARBI1 [Heterodontus francisci]|uniref:putative nuclease HARBI1 n=1 Tax=Heterodontus francisci TaxID=7792 RepID=UPI00355B8E21